MALFGYLLTGLGQGAGEEATTGSTGSSAAGQSLTVGAELETVDVQDLALSTVQLIGLDRSLEPQCAGSGVIVDSAGLILTNAHVITTQGGCKFNSIGVARTVDASSAAELRYRAEVLVVDEALDLAVVRIAGWLDPSRSEELPATFPTAALGDSGSVGLGDGVRILGYPAIGGETITLTTGTVSGFSSQAGVGSRALIKTDATISAGNSGGMAVDANGRVIGIPTKAQATESGPAIDCRPVSDTNGDGTVDDNDACVSVGGFLNGIRPINLARPILAVASTAEPIGPVAFPAGPRSDLDFDLIDVSNPRFSLGESNGGPVDVVSTAQSGVEQLCIFFDWSGIPQGTRWDSAWFIDGVPKQNTQQQREPWNYDEAGTDLWFCVEEEGDVGLPAGIYEFGFFLETDVLFAEGIVLTDQPVEVVPVTWSNDTGVELCGLAVNPLSDSGQVGMNELDQGETIPPGESRTIDLPLGRYVVEAYSCEGEAVADNFAGLPVEGPVTFLVGIGPSN
jgi:S1-C subfamily serine protease